MARNVQLPDGQVIEGVPDNVPDGAVFEQAIRAGIWKPDLAEYGGYPEEQGIGNQFNIGAGKFFADRIPGMDNSAPLPDSVAALVGNIAPALIGGLLVPGSVPAQALYGGAVAAQKDASATDVLEGAAWSGGLAGAFNMAGRVVNGIRGAGRATRTIGEALDSNPMKRLEAGVQSAGGLDFLAARRAKELSSSVAASFGQQADNLLPDVLSRGAREIGLMFEALVPAKASFDISDALAAAEGLNIGVKAKSLLPKAGTTVTGNGFKNLRAELSERIGLLKGDQDDLAADLIEVVKRMDDSAEKVLGPTYRQDYRVARELWKNLKIAERLPTVKKGLGYATPDSLATRLASDYDTSFIRDTGKVLPQTQQLFDKTRELVRLRAPVGDSGTATRVGSMAALGGLGAAVGGLYNGDVEGAAYGAGAALLPYLAGRGTVALGSRLGPQAPQAVGQAGGLLGILMNQEPEERP